MTVTRPRSTRHGWCDDMERDQAEHSLSVGASRLLAVLAESRHTRWPLDDLELKHLEAVPHMRGRPDSRRELGAIIDELAMTGRVKPSVRRDRTRMPPLPAFIDVVRTPRDGSARGEARGHGWRPELSRVLALQPPPTSAEVRVLRQVNAWIAERSTEASVCGSRERSLEIFGDEKLLDERLRYGRLFTGGLLTYELLRSRRVAPGLVTEVVGRAPTVLVVENTDTFRAIADVLAESADSQVGLVAWGAGAAFEQSCGALSALSVAGQAVSHGWYFGDVDPSGLRIPAHAADLVAPLPLEAAGPLYDLLFDRDQRVPARERIADGTEQHLLWLGEPRARRARAVISDEKRLPQEALRAEILRSLNGHLV